MTQFSKQILKSEKNIDTYRLSKDNNEVLENSGYGTQQRTKSLFQEPLSRQFPPDEYKMDLDSMRWALDSHLKGFTINLDKNELHKDSKYTTSVNWFPSDDEDLFYTNMKDEKISNIMYKSGWCTSDKKPKDDLTYNLNKWGFRCVNFRQKNPRPGILSLGCSFTFGVGLRNDQTFAQKVATHFDLENYNIGIPGRGLDLLAFYLSLFIEREMDLGLIKAIVVFMPPPGRETFFSYQHNVLRLVDVHNDPLASTNYYTNNFLKDIEEIDQEILELFGLNGAIEKDKKEVDKLLDAGLKNHLNEYRSSLYEHNYFTQENNFKRDLLNVNSIKLFAMENNIPLIIHQNKPTVASASDFARDMMHFGPKTHDNIARSIISKLNIHLT